ncbi:MAG: glutathione S-transferase [Myxococcota bacterium]|jgi:glutathione S-transferase
MDLVLYGAPLSPFVRKADVVMREKGIEFEVEALPVPLPDSFAAINPARRMPALRDRDISAEGPEGVIPDSSAICAYLERLVPEPSMYPQDAYEYGRALWYEEYCDSDLAGKIGLGIFRPIVFALFAKKEPDVATARKTMTEVLPHFFDYFEGELEGKEYLVGGAFSIADLSLVTQLINLGLAVGPPDPARWPGITALVERVSSRPSFGPNLAICKKILAKPVDLGL